MKTGSVVGLAIFFLVIAGGLTALYHTDDVKLQCSVSETGVVQDRETTEYHTIPHANLISVTVAKDEEHSVAVVRGMKGTQMFSYPGKCKAVK
jgi:hypothetical protein